MQNVKIVRNLRTSALLCRNDNVRTAGRYGYAIDPWTADRTYIATGYPPVR